MGTETLVREDESGLTLYFAAQNPAGLWLDFADYVFKALSTTHAITAVTTGIAGAGAFKVATDITGSLVVGQKIRVTGSTGNNGVYTIRSGSSYSAPDTTINVDEAVPDATVDGTINLTATPYLSATGVDVANGRKRYSASFDWADAAPGLAAVQMTIGCYEQVGASPVPTSDTLKGQIQSLSGQLGEPGLREFRTQVKLGATSTEGTTLELMAWLEADGRKVDLYDLDPSATCSVVCKRRGNVSQFTISTGDMGSVNADHCFEPTYANPNFTADRIYRAEAIIVADGITFDGNLKGFSVVP